MMRTIQSRLRRTLSNSSDQKKAIAGANNL